MIDEEYIADMEMDMIRTRVLFRFAEDAVRMEEIAKDEAEKVYGEALRRYEFAKDHIGYPRRYA